MSNTFLYGAWPQSTPHDDAMEADDAPAIYVNVPLPSSASLPTRLGSVSEDDNANAVVMPPSRGYGGLLCVIQNRLTTSFCRIATGAMFTFEPELGFRTMLPSEARYEAPGDDWLRNLIVETGKAESLVPFLPLRADDRTRFFPGPWSPEAVDVDLLKKLLVEA